MCWTGSPASVGKLLCPVFPTNGALELCSLFSSELRHHTMLIQSFVCVLRNVTTRPPADQSQDASDPQTLTPAELQLAARLSFRIVFVSASVNHQFKSSQIINFENLYHGVLDVDLLKDDHGHVRDLVPGPVVVHANCLV